MTGEPAEDDAAFSWGGNGMDASPYSFGLDVGLQPALHVPIDGYTPLPPVTTDQEIINHYSGSPPYKFIKYASYLTG